MVRDLKEGKRAVMMALRELEKTGYLLRSRLYGGRMEYLMRHDPEFESDGQDNHNTDCSFSNKPKEQPAKTATVSNIVLESNKEEESNKERGETSSPCLGGSKILSKEKYSPYLGSPMDYFRDEAKRRHKLLYLDREHCRNDKLFFNKNGSVAAVNVLDTQKYCRFNANVEDIKITSTNTGSVGTTQLSLHRVRNGVDTVIANSAFVVPSGFSNYGIPYKVDLVDKGLLKGDIIYVSVDSISTGITNLTVQLVLNERL
jgi:hypothetical protein